MPVTLEFFFDYGCPFSYAGWEHLKTFIHKYPQLTVVYRPVEAHPAPEPRLDIQGIAGWWENRLQAYLELPFPVGIPHHPMPRSHRVLAGLFYVQDQGADPVKYSNLVFEAAFGAAADIEQPQTLRELAKKMELSEKDFLTAVSSEPYHLRVKQANVYAYDTKKINYVPTFIVKDQRLEAIEARGVTPAALEDFLSRTIGKVREE